MRTADDRATAVREAAILSVRPRSASDLGPHVIALSGRLDVAHVGAVWTRMMQETTAADGHALTLDLSGISGCDTAGVTLLLDVERAHSGETRIEGAPAAVRELLDRIRPLAGSPTGPSPTLPARGGSASAAPQRRPRPQLLAAFAKAAVRGGDEAAFVGEAVLAVIRLPTRRRMLRAAEFGRLADQAGVRAVPLVLLLGVLMGLILAFQSLVPLRRFGADLYVANLVGISLTRELGPLLAAVVLSGRTGSAFAAEIGTMKVNQEIDALRTLGLDPMTMLVLPRLVAAVLVIPALTILLEIAGLIGMVLVLQGFGFPPVAVANQLSIAVKARDVYGGLIKCVVFGAVIAAIGCRAGLSTGVGPRAVGLSATSAVVGGIVATIIIDGCFSLLYFRMGM